MEIQMTINIPRSPCFCDNGVIEPTCIGRCMRLDARLTRIAAWVTKAPWTPPGRPGVWLDADDVKEEMYEKLLDYGCYRKPFPASHLTRLARSVARMQAQHLTANGSGTATSLTVDDNGEDAQVSDPSLLPDESRFLDERNEKLAALVAGLNAEEREVVILRYYEELKVEEIAIIQGVTPHKVQRRHQRALKKLGQRGAELLF